MAGRIIHRSNSSMTKILFGLQVILRPLRANLIRSCLVLFSVLAHPRMAVAQESWEWKLVEPTPAVHSLTGVAYGTNQFVAVGRHGTILTSTNGQQWVPRTSGVTHDLFRVVFGNGMFVAVGQQQIAWHSEWIPQVESIILTSPDGTTWTQRLRKADFDLREISADNGRFVIAGSLTEITQFEWKSLWRGAVFTSLNGWDWAVAAQTFGDLRPLGGVAYGNGGWLIYNSDNETWFSKDAVRWDMVHPGGKSFFGPEVDGYLTYLEDMKRFAAIGRGVTPGDRRNVAHLHLSWDGKEWDCVLSGCSGADNRYPPMNAVLSLDRQQIFVGKGILTRQGPQALVGNGSLGMQEHHFDRPVWLYALAASSAAIVAVGAADGTVGQNEPGLADYVGVIVISQRKRLALPLGEAVNAPGLVWRTDPLVPWFGQTNFTFDGFASAQCGVPGIGIAETSWMETDVKGPGVLRFRWRLSNGSDDLTFVLDGIRQPGWNGSPFSEVNWASEQIEIPAGSHTLRWAFSRPSFLSDFGGVGWVDDVNWQPDSGAPPKLQVRYTNGQLNLAWPAAGFVLQSADNITGGPWTSFTPVSNLAEGQRLATVPIAGSRRFYRLIRTPP